MIARLIRPLVIGSLSIALIACINSVPRSAEQSTSAVGNRSRRLRPSDRKSAT